MTLKAGLLAGVWQASDFMGENCTWVLPSSKIALAKPYQLEIFSSYFKLFHAHFLNAFCKNTIIHIFFDY